MKNRVSVPSLILALLLCGVAGAQDFTAGTFHSYKGIGLTFQTGFEDPEEFNTFTLYAEMSGLYSGKEGRPGVKFNYSHNHRIVKFDSKDQSNIHLYLGPGATVGYVKDNGRDSYGIAAALSGTIGIEAAFLEKRCLITLGFTIEAGSYMFRDKGSLSFVLYRDGFYQAVYPQITVSYVFK